MSDVNVILVNSFTKGGSGGNAAGVVLKADSLSDEQKLQVAKEVGFSETAFVSSDSEYDFEVSFYTTTDEVDFCGHATVAAFSTMFEQGVIGAGNYIQKTKAGALSVEVEANGKVVMQQKLPEYLGQFSPDEIATMLGVDPKIISSTKLPVEVVSTGLPDVIIPVQNGNLDDVKPNDALISAFCKKHQVVGFHVFELNEKGALTTASCRNFAPLYGISEESATGTSNGALACYLAKHLGLEGELVFEQGRAMNCISQIDAMIDIRDRKVVELSVGGYAIPFDIVSIKV